MELIEQSAREMSAMLEKLNAKTREVTINLGVHTIEELLDNVRRKSSSLLHQHNIQLTMVIHYKGTIHCDLHLMAEDLFNLIANAVHAVSKRIDPMIRMEISTYGRYAYLSL